MFRYTSHLTISGTAAAWVLFGLSMAVAFCQLHLADPWPAVFTAAAGVAMLLSDLDRAKGYGLLDARDFGYLLGIWFAVVVLPGFIATVLRISGVSAGITNAALLGIYLSVFLLRRQLQLRGWPV